MDSAAWELFLRNFNGKAIMLPDIWEDSNTLQLGQIPRDLLVTEPF